MSEMNNRRNTRNLLIQKIVCNSSLSEESLTQLSLCELKRKWNELNPSSHPHGGFGSLRWKR